MSVADLPTAASGGPAWPATPGTTAFVLKGYPRLSETFIAQEIRALEQRGLRILIVAMRRPTDRATHPIHDEIAAPVVYLPEYLHRAPRQVFAAWRAVRRRPGYRAALRAWWRDLRRDRSRNRMRRFGQALVLAHRLPTTIGWLHAHFLHTPASVTRYASLITGLPWSVSAHAKDIWTTPDWEKAEKLAACRWLVTCTEAGATHLRALADDPGRVALAYHGLDLERFGSAATVARPRRTGADPRDPAIILSVGRLVDKKGYPDLLDALALLPAPLNWRLVHIGAGPERRQLAHRAEALGIADRIDWLGAQAHDTVIRHYRAADLFVLASRIAPDGDRDGLPNVLMEAQSQGLACVATAVSAIPELIRPDETGLLVPPRDPPALAAALERLIVDPELRARLGGAGHQRLLRGFSHVHGIDRLAALFGLPSEQQEACVSRSMHR
ncbi:MAG TPA: glycosyltransferase family 4 protein [Candidatus Sulfotelmatobacter sp.]|nr:glycosyltransferase family 4 protein [Candidatus Sulfotelmatobacter sp.]